MAPKDRASDPARAVLFPLKKGQSMPHYAGDLSRHSAPVKKSKKAKKKGK